MPPQPTPPEPDFQADPLAYDSQHHRRVLNELIEIGADFARLLHQEAKAQTQPETGAAITLADLTIAFDRVARAIRRTVALARKLAEPIPAPTAPDPIQNRITARKCIIREVEDHIHRKPRGPEAETLHNEFYARLDSPDLEDDIENRPVADIIADICHDLGLASLPGSQLFKRRTPEDVLALCARAATPRRIAILVRPKPPGGDPPWRPAQTAAH